MTTERPATRQEIYLHFSNMACDCRISDDGIVTFRGSGHCYFTKGDPMAAYVISGCNVYFNPYYGK